MANSLFCVTDEMKCGQQQRPNVKGNKLGSLGLEPTEGLNQVLRRRLEKSVLLSCTLAQLEVCGADLCRDFFTIHSVTSATHVNPLDGLAGFSSAAVCTDSTLLVTNVRCITGED